jgi:hypothetical protein
MLMGIWDFADRDERLFQFGTSPTRTNAIRPYRNGIGVS